MLKSCLNPKPTVLLQIILGQPVMVPIKPSQCAITKLKLDRDRTNLLARKAAKGVTKPKGEKYTEKDVQKK
jgi:hypothetical protein